MHLTALGGLEGHRTDGALVEDLAVLLLDVALLALEGLENHVAVETPETGGREIVVCVVTRRFEFEGLARGLTHLYQALRA